LQPSGLLFANYFIGIGTFVVTIGGGFWISNRGIEADALPLAGAGVALIQFGYTLLGSAILGGVSPELAVPALAVTTAITGLLTAGVVVLVYRTDRSFDRWQLYSRGLFVAGFVAGSVGVFVNPTLVLLASVLFFLGFVTDLTYEIWAVKDKRVRAHAPKRDRYLHRRNGRLHPHPLTRVADSLASR